MSAEIVEFCRFLEPTREEDETREEALGRITDIVLKMFPSAQVKLFGSFATGQSLHFLKSLKSFILSQRSYLTTHRDEGAPL